MNASSGGPSAAALVSLPSKSLTADRDLSHDQREELQRLARTIREEESARMQYEDQRRRLYLNQTGERGSGGSTRSQRGAVQGSAGANNVPFSSAASIASGNSSFRANAHSASTQRLVPGGLSPVNQGNSVGASAGAGHYSTDYFFDTPVNIGLSATRSATGKGGMAQAMRKPTQPEIDAAFKWLCIPRALVIAERTPKEYVFAVVVAGADEASQSYGESKSNAKGQKSFVFEWREGALRGGSVPDVLAGCVYVSEIRDISGPSGDMDTFTIVIGSSTKALRNSKGRTTVAVKCSSPGECAKYLASLKCLRRSYED